MCSGVVILAIWENRRSVSSITDQCANTRVEGREGAEMQFMKPDDGLARSERPSITKRLAFLFCLIATGIGWAAIIGLILLLKPDLLF